MKSKEILEQIKAKGLSKFKAVSIDDNKTHRCFIETASTIFVYAYNKKRYGWRLDEEQFLRHFMPLIPNDENAQWKRRLKRAINLCRESGLWADIAAVWDNLYKYVTLDEKRKIYDMSWDNREATVAYCKEHYFRITGYCESEDFCFIMDCYGMFEKLWQFSSYLLQKGLKVLEVGGDSKFMDGNIDRIDENAEKMYLRANADGKPEYVTQTINGVTYNAVKVADKIYIPDRTQTV